MTATDNAHPESAHGTSDGTAGTSAGDTIGVIACAWCGTVAGDALPLTWTASREGSGTATTMRYYCPDCSRENARSIEGRLDAAWW